MPTGSRIIGVDASPFVLGIGQEYELSEAHPIEYLLGDARRLPFPDRSFDMVVFANTLKYLGTEENELAALQEHVRILRPGGQLLVVDGNDSEITYRGADSDLSRRVVDGYSALQGDAQSGSRIADFFQLLGLRRVRQAVIPLRETEFTGRHAGFAMAQNMRDVLTEFAATNPGDAIVSPPQLDSFCTQLGEAAVQGTYEWEYTKYAAVGIRPA